MTYVPNPFRARLAEQQRDIRQFVRTFGAGMLGALPDDQNWSRFTVLRSAPGAGKTSILRMFTPQPLEAVHRDREEYAELATRLTRLGAIDESGVSILGILISVGRDYRSLVDLGPKGDARRKVFFKLLDARIAIKCIEAVAALRDIEYSEGLDRIQFRVLTAAGAAAASSLGYAQGLETFTARSMFDAAHAAESDVLRFLDSLRPVHWQGAGHANLYFPRLVSNVEILVDGAPLTVTPVLMFDDVHDLASEQREFLYDELLDRAIGVGRWIAERTSAQTDNEVLTNATPEGRDRSVVVLEEVMKSKNSLTHRLFSEVANARASAPLRMLDREEPFTSLLGEDLAERPRRGPDRRSRLHDAVYGSQAKVRELVGQFPQFESWSTDPVPGSQLADQAVRSAEVAIRIQRELNKGLLPLFDDADLSAATDLTSSDTKEAARLFVCRAFKLPYYFGAAMLTDLATRNIEQYLDVSGDLFDLMVSSSTISGSPSLSPWEQHRQITESSRNYWARLPQRIPFGPEVAKLLHAIAAFCRSETYLPNAPYAPGVTGIAIEMSSFNALLEIANPEHPGARLARAIATAVSYNLLEMRPGARNPPVVILYLNRLLCPHFYLPLQRGGWRTQQVPKLLQWMESPALDSVGAPDPALVLDGVGRQGAWEW